MCCLAFINPYKNELYVYTVTPNVLPWLQAQSILYLKIAVASQISADMTARGVCIV